MSPIGPSRTSGSSRLEAEFANSLGYWSTDLQRVFAHFSKEKGRRFLYGLYRIVSGAGYQRGPAPKPIPTPPGPTPTPTLGPLL